jgi:hypothetical protein
VQLAARPKETSVPERSTLCRCVAPSIGFSRPQLAAAAAADAIL